MLLRIWRRRFRAPVATQEVTRMLELERRITVTKVRWRDSMLCRVVSYMKLTIGQLALDFIEKKTGHTQSRETNEKLTDKARDLYEKQTGFV